MVGRVSCWRAIGGIGATAVVRGFRFAGGFRVADRCTRGDCREVIRLGCLQLRLRFAGEIECCVHFRVGPIGFLRGASEPVCEVGGEPVAGFHFRFCGLTLGARLVQLGTEIRSGICRGRRRDEWRLTERGSAVEAMEPDGGALCELQRMQGFSAGSGLLVHGLVPLPAEMMKHLGGIARHDAALFEQSDQHEQIRCGVRGRKTARGGHGGRSDGFRQLAKARQADVRMLETGMLRLHGQPQQVRVVIAQKGEVR